MFRSSSFGEVQMKQCPTCNRTFADYVTFCIVDGAILSAPYDSEETQRIPSPRITNPPPAEVLRPTPSHSQPIQRGVKPLLVYILIALLFLVIGGGVVMLLRPAAKDYPSVVSPTPGSTPNTVPKHEQANTSKQEQVNIESESSSDQSTDIPPLTIDGINALISRWKNAQNSGDFPTYQSCYGLSFEGILRTASGRLRTYSFNTWLRDRKRMINQSGGVVVDIKNTHIRIEADVATVEFDQYYRSLSYSDWGPKIIKIKMSPAGERIVYEELKASYPL
jgi:hypothetical protein